ncbi:MAG: addiction module protein [Planctomycetia bacterium]
MSLAEKLEAMEALWADSSRTAADVPVPQWHRDVLKARLESPATWLDWEQVKASLREMARQEGDAPGRPPVTAHPPRVRRSSPTTGGRPADRS